MLSGTPLLSSNFTSIEQRSRQESDVNQYKTNSKQSLNHKNEQKQVGQDKLRLLKKLQYDGLIYDQEKVFKFQNENGNSPDRQKNQISLQSNLLARLTSKGNSRAAKSKDQMYHTQKHPFNINSIISQNTILSEDEEDNEDPTQMTWRKTAKKILSRDVYEKTKKYSSFYMELSSLNEKIKLYKHIFDSQNEQQHQLLENTEKQLNFLKSLEKKYGQNVRIQMSDQENKEYYRLMNQSKFEKFYGSASGRTNRQLINTSGSSPDHTMKSLMQKKVSFHGLEDMIGLIGQSQGTRNVNHQNYVNNFRTAGNLPSNSILQTPISVLKDNPNINKVLLNNDSSTLQVSQKILSQNASRNSRNSSRNIQLDRSNITNKEQIQDFSKNEVKQKLKDISIKRREISQDIGVSKFKNPLNQSRNKFNARQKQSRNKRLVNKSVSDAQQLNLSLPSIKSIYKNNQNPFNDYTNNNIDYINVNQSLQNRNLVTASVTQQHGASKRLPFYTPLNNQVNQQTRAQALHNLLNPVLESARSSQMNNKNEDKKSGECT
eukprot:403354009